MTLRPDIHTALYIALIVLLTLAVWRVGMGVLAASPATENLGKAGLAITG